MIFYACSNLKERPADSDNFVSLLSPHFFIFFGHHVQLACDGEEVDDPGSGTGEGNRKIWKEQSVVIFDSTA